VNGVIARNVSKVQRAPVPPGTPLPPLRLLRKCWTSVGLELGFGCYYFSPLTWMFGLDFSRKRKSRTRSV